MAQDIVVALMGVMAEDETSSKEEQEKTKEV